MAYSHAGSNICLARGRGKGPVPPDLKALQNIGVDFVGLDVVIDILFHLDKYDSSSPPMLWKGGSLRQGLTLVHFSSQLEPCLSQENTLHILNTP